MKHILAAMLFLSFLVPTYAQTAAEKVSVKISAGKFTINKAQLTKGWKHDAVSVAVAGNDRRRAGFNTTHTYDSYGIVLFEKNNDKLPSGILSEVQFYFGAMDSNNVKPTGLFVGKFQVEKLKITSAITSDELKNQLKDYVQTDSYMEHNFRLVYKGLYIYFLFNAEETQLLKISVGPDTRNSTDSLN
jgi:hypothetical protein